MRFLPLLCILVSATALGETSDGHPVLSPDGSWVPVMVMIIGFMFLMAAVIGPIVRANAPEEVPPAHAHDEPPGTSHHHGKSGLINPSPEDELHH